MAMEPGQSIGDYEILGLLGSGGMGRVYKVRSHITQRIEAMKVLLDEISTNQELSERFLREIQISAALDHPNIAALRAAQRVENSLLMIMEFVDGSTLADLMQRKWVTLLQSLQFVSQALGALEYAHAQNVIHRDLKPGNMMVTAAGQVKLMDFGIARLTTDSRLTKTGFLVGSLYYMSPEQIEGGVPNARSDIYALGVTLYELATGKRPFEGDTEYQIMAAHLKGAPVPPTEIDSALPRSISDLILSAIARDPAQRFASAKAMRNALEVTLRDTFAAAAPTPAQKPAAATVPATAARPTLPPVVPKRSHRSAYMLAGAAVVLAIFVGVVEMPNLRRARASVPPSASTTKAVIPEGATSGTAQPVAQPSGTVSSSAPAVEGNKETTRIVQRPKPIANPSSAAPLPVPLDSPYAQQQPRQPETGAVAPTANQPEAASQDSSALAELKERFSHLSDRAAAVQTSIDNLQRAQAQSGLSLRGDMAYADQHASSLLRQAEADLQRADDLAARKHLDSAEAEIEKLEKFFGR